MKARPADLLRRSTIINRQSSIDSVRMWGLAALGFYCAHTACHVSSGTPEHLLWTCHISTIAVGLGLLTRRRWLAATGTLVLVVGFPAWLIGLLTGGEFLPTSLLTHVGGLLIGIAGTAKLGGYRRDAWQALALVAVLVVISRAGTPPEANVNLAFRPWVPLPQFARSSELHVAILLIGWAIGLKTAEAMLRRMQPGQILRGRIMIL